MAENTAREGLITTEDVDVIARKIDFISRFERNWEHLRDIMGVMRMIKKTPGSVITKKTVTGELEETVGEGEIIPYSKFQVAEEPYDSIDIEKYAKAVSLEAIKENGYEDAVQLTDNEFLFELQTMVTDRFYTYINEGSLTGKEDSWQMALAMAKGKVLNKFKKMKRTVTDVVGFVNVLDVYRYIGAAGITIQNEFGFQYVKDFMGYSTVFLLSEDEVAEGTVIATAVENLVLYYVDPGEADFAKAGLVYTTGVGEIKLIGVHVGANYNTAVSELHAILGLRLFAEYQDAIAVIKVKKDTSGEELGN